MIALLLIAALAQQNDSLHSTITADIKFLSGDQSVVVNEYATIPERSIHAVMLNRQSKGPIDIIAKSSVADKREIDLALLDTCLKVLPPAKKEGLYPSTNLALLRCSEDALNSTTFQRTKNRIKSNILFDLIEQEDTKEFFRMYWMLYDPALLTKKDWIDPEMQHIGNATAALLFKSIISRMANADQVNDADVKALYHVLFYNLAINKNQSALLMYLSYIALFTHEGERLSMEELPLYALLSDDDKKAFRLLIKDKNAALKQLETGGIRSDLLCPACWEVDCMSRMYQDGATTLIDAGRNIHFDLDSLQYLVVSEAKKLQRCDLGEP